MASPRFETAIRTLWAQLRLPPPRLGAEDMVTLAVEGTDIRLAESRDGNGLVISASPGRLSADAMERARQVGLLLRANLGFLLGSAAGLHLEEGPSNPVRIETVHPYGGVEEDGLLGRVEDVLRRTEFHRPDLADPHATDPRQPFPAQGLAAGEETRGDFILRL